MDQEEKADICWNPSVLETSLPDFYLHFAGGNIVTCLVLDAKEVENYIFKTGCKYPSLACPQDSLLMKEGRMDIM